MTCEIRADECFVLQLHILKKSGYRSVLGSVVPVISYDVCDPKGTASPIALTAEQLSLGHLCDMVWARQRGYHWLVTALLATIR